MGPCFYRVSFGAMGDRLASVDLSWEWMVQMQLRRASELKA